MKASMRSIENAVGERQRAAIAPVFVAILLMALLLFSFKASVLADGTPEERKLLALAKLQFGVLTTADEKVFRSAANGEWAVYSIKDEQKDRTLLAERIAWLLCDKRARELVTHKGIQVMGARIEGVLDLAYMDINAPIMFLKCALPQGLYLRHSNAIVLLLDGSQVGPIISDGIKVKGNVSMRDGFRAEGEVRLLGAEIGGDLTCTNGQFINPDGYALNADRVRVTGSVYFRDDFRAEGEVRLPGADIGSNLECTNSRFINPEQDALNLRGIKVGGNIFLRDGFMAEGAVQLSTAEIRGSLQCHGIDSATGMMLDLRAAKAGTYYDDYESWPKSGCLYLDGFVYERLDDRAPRDGRLRVQWLGRQSSDQFLPQPYEQLAAVFQREGFESDAQKILIAKEEDPARLRQMNIFRKLWHYVEKGTICYGYRPWYALLWASGLVIIGRFVFASGMNHNLVAPTSESAYVVKPDSGVRRLVETYPRFNSLFYSLDVLLPIIDLHQERYWLPHVERGSAVGWLKWVRWLGISAPTYGSLLSCYMWFQILSGWLLTSLFIAGLTRAVRS